LLRICALGALPDAVTNAYVAVRQAQRRLRAAVGLNFAMAGIALVGAAFLMPHWGINGVGWAWTGAQTLGALWVISRALHPRRRHNLRGPTVPEQPEHQRPTLRASASSSATSMARKTT
jgi:O-antigen/teichoic acid export membrane protein